MTIDDINDSDAVTDDSAVGSDRDNHVITTTNSHRERKLNLVFGGRTVDHNVRRANDLSSTQWMEIVSGDVGELWNLMNSVAKHRLQSLNEFVIAEKIRRY